MVRTPYRGRPTDESAFITPSYTSGTKGLQRGHVLIEPATEAELKRMRHQLKGAWVLVSGKMWAGLSIILPKLIQFAMR